MPYRVGFDVGGTFTDFVLQSPTGELTTAKRLTTYPDPSAACLAGLDQLMAAVGWDEVAQVVHGTTLGSTSSSSARPAAWDCSPRAASVTCSSSDARNAIRSTTSR